MKIDQIGVNRAREITLPQSIFRQPTFGWREADKYASARNREVTELARGVFERFPFVPGWPSYHPELFGGMTRADRRHRYAQTLQTDAIFHEAALAHARIEAEKWVIARRKAMERYLHRYHQFLETLKERWRIEEFFRQVRARRQLQEALISAARMKHVAREQENVAVRLAATAENLREAEEHLLRANGFTATGVPGPLSHSSLDTRQALEEIGRRRLEASTKSLREVQWSLAGVALGLYTQLGREIAPPPRLNLPDSKTAIGAIAAGPKKA